MVFKLPNQVLFISNSKERSVYITVYQVDGAPPDFKPYSAKIQVDNNMKDTDIALMIDSMQTDLEYSDFLDRVRAFGTIQKLDNIIDLFQMLKDYLKENGIYAYQIVLRLFIPADYKEGIR